MLLAGFGAPSSLAEVRAFLIEVTAGRGIPAARLDEVESHYRAVGGSPYNRLAEELADSLERQLASRSLPLPVCLGMRCWEPRLDEVLEGLKRRGVRIIVAVLLAPHEGKASTQRYVEAIELARKRTAPNPPSVLYLKSWHKEPGFIEGVVARVEQACEGLDQARRCRAAWIFTAHSIPLADAQGSPYAVQVEETVDEIAGRLGVEPLLAWQSRSGARESRWLEPDLGQRIRELAGSGFDTIVVTPVGFLLDHVEILYDLDIEAASIAQELGLTMVRVPTVGNHPSFTAMLADKIEDTLARAEG